MKPDWYENFFWWKLGALTHDPPHKAWIITGKITWSNGLGNVEGVKVAENRKLRGHEAAAFTICATAFSEDIADYFFLKEWKDIIDKSDRLASSFDRWQISEIYKLRQELEIRYHPFDVKEVYLFNPLSGDLIKPEATRINLKDFVEDLRNIWSKTSELSLNLRYHIFFSLYEPLFYDKCLNTSGPADTRTPSHTLFDHLYACATVINWLCSDAIAGRKEPKPKGLLVRIDLAGVQDFISASRKLRDVWFSSWLASALVFKTIEELIEQLGPDILIRPTARHNPFYYNLLLRWIEKEQVPKEIQERLKEIAEKYAGLKREELWPQHAVIPATIDLLLPPYEVLSQLLNKEIRNEDEFILYLHERYINCWKNLVDIGLKEGVKRIIERYKLEGELKGKLEHAVEKSYNYGIKNTPPFIMRIVVVSIPEDLSSEKNEQELWYYNYAFETLSKKFESIKLIKIHPACFTNLTKVTEDAWKNKKRYYMCTVCGGFPSVFDIPYEEDEYNRTVPLDLQVYFDLGEHLCPYCLIKRLATHPAIFTSITEELINCPAHPPSFPSTSFIATYPFIRGLIEAQDDENVRNIVNEIIKQLRKLGRLSTSYWDALRELQGKAKDRVKEFLYYDAELTLLPEEKEARRRVEKLRKAVEKSVRGTLDPAFTRINTYYAIVRANGDYIGSLLSGCLNQETIGMNYIDLLVSSIESIPDEKARKFARLIRESANNNIRVVERILRSELGHQVGKAVKLEEIKKTAENLCKLFSKTLKEGKIPVTPAYHAMLSRALMITALKDIKAVQERAKGIVIYAGGDDLLAFIPAIFAINLVFKTRIHYSIGDLEHRGFHRLGNGYFMSLGRASRTYSVVFGHFKYPMSQLLRLSHRFLREAKKVQVVHGVLKRAKNVLLLAYCPRGGGIKVKSILPLSHEKPVKLLMSLIDDIENNLLSRSVIYDLMREIKKYGKEVLKLRVFDIIGDMLNYLMHRNLIIESAKPAIKLIASELKELADYTILDDEGNEETLLYHITLALWATTAALRGREV